MGHSLSELFVQGGWVMYPLLVFSIGTWAVLFERSYTFILRRHRLRKGLSSILQSLRAGDKQTAKQLCLTQNPEQNQTLVQLIQSKDSEIALRLMDRLKFTNNLAFRKNLWILATIGSASPFVGLLGTVIGIVRAFNDMSEKGAGGFSVVAGGISEALIATAAGLVVAIVALLTYNVFSTLATQAVQSLKLSLDEIFDLVVEK